MRFARSACAIGAIAGGLSLAPAPAVADPGNGCTFQGAPVGQFVKFVTQTFGNNAQNNPGNSMAGVPPFVPSFVGCNPTGNPNPPR
jgi:hypothetical protein